MKPLAKALIAFAIETGRPIVIDGNCSHVMNLLFTINDEALPMGQHLTWQFDDVLQRWSGDLTPCDPAGAW